MSNLRPELRFRDFLQVLKNENDLVEITHECDPNLEVGAIMRRVYEEKLPVPLFKNLKKDPKNPDPSNLFNIVGCLGGLRDAKKDNDHARIALHLGLDSQTPMTKIIDYLIEAKTKNPLPPVLLEDASGAPCKKNKISGDDIRLNALPAPTLHHGDGGKYIQTYGMFVLQTADKTWTNWSIARGMIYDDKHLTGLVMNPQHIRRVADTWAEIGMGDRVPFALCFGVPPASILVSSMPIPDGATEADYIGALVGEPLSVVKCETNDLQVPADSEMVFEGTLNLNKMVEEGPFGEMHGYCFPGHGHPCPLYTVETITYRDDAILPVSNPGLCTDETHTLIGGLVSAECKQMALEHPKLKSVIMEAFTPYEGVALWLALRVNTKELAKLNTNSEEFCKLIGDYYYSSKPGLILQEIVLVGDDVDIFDFRKLFWAYATRHTPGDDQYMFNDYRAFPLAPFIGQGPRIKTLKGGNCVTDCLFPKQYEPEGVDFVTCDFDGYDEAIKEKVLKNWSAYGYK